MIDLEENIILCTSCNKDIKLHLGDGYLPYKRLNLCINCIIDIIEPIYDVGRAIGGGLVPVIYRACLQSRINKTKKRIIPNYKKIFQELLHKYNFMCCWCGTKEKSKLTIDHIIPTSKGGSDEIGNLQILCRSCNSKKGAKI